MTTDATQANVRCNDGLDARSRSALSLDGPTVVSFSGGRTSAYMLRLLLDAHGGKLPPDCHVVFANTGKEDEKTLRFVADCSRYWNVPITWVEYRDMEREMFAQIGEHDVEAFSAAARTIKCLQIANGAAYIDDQAERWVEVHDAKLQALESVVAEAGGAPVLVAYGDNNAAALERSGLAGKLLHNVAINLPP